MTTMLEKMARAMRDSEPGMEGKSWRYWLPSARAALQAIREVDERSAVFYAGLSAMAGYNDSGPAEPWTAMIDAILSEDKG